MIKEANPSTINRNLDLKRAKMTILEHNDKTTKQLSTPKQVKKVSCKPKTDPPGRKIQENKQIHIAAIRPKSWPSKIEV